MDVPWPDGQNEGHASSSYGLVSPDSVRRVYRGNLAKRKVFALLISVAALAAVWKISTSSSASSPPSEYLDCDELPDDTWFFGDRDSLSTRAMDETNGVAGTSTVLQASAKFEQMGLIHPRWFMQMGYHGAVMSAAKTVQLPQSKCAQTKFGNLFKFSKNGKLEAVFPDFIVWADKMGKGFNPKLPAFKSACGITSKGWVPLYEADKQEWAEDRCAKHTTSVPSLFVDHKNDCQKDAAGCRWRDSDAITGGTCLLAGGTVTIDEPVLSPIQVDTYLVSLGHILLYRLVRFSAPTSSLSSVVIPFSLGDLPPRSSSPFLSLPAPVLRLSVPRPPLPPVWRAH